MARGSYEPWGILRKPLPAGMKVSDCLSEFQTGGLRRIGPEKPFDDVIVSGRTPQRERKIVNHPSLKPQALLRQIVRASLPLGVGIIADPFMGSGSTIAAAEAKGLTAIGCERYLDYYELSRKAIPLLARLPVSVEQGSLEL
jgi:site-specific DNA-methyltransferase (adenine-specific)